MSTTPPVDLTGNTYGRLAVLSYAGRHPKNRSHLWLCRCECGTQKIVRGASLTTSKGGTRSCGCLLVEHNERMRRAGPDHPRRKHGRYAGHDNSPTGRSWRAMMQRVYDPNHPKHYLYGGRGIEVCERWRGPEGYRNFLADMGERPEGDWTIDRIDPDGDYEPANCRWLPLSENSRRVRRDVSFKS